MSTLQQVVVLYEDQRGPTGDFALHDLILECVYDSIDDDRKGLTRAVKGIPKKGNNKVLKALSEDLDDIKRYCRHVVAVFDDDKIRGLLGLGKKEKEQAVIEEIKSRISNGAFVCLLERNMETVVENVRDCDPTVDRHQVERALQKSPNDRDLLLKKATAPASQKVRDCILKKNPSMDRIVRLLCKLVRP